MCLNYTLPGFMKGQGQWTSILEITPTVILIQARYISSWRVNKSHSGNIICDGRGWNSIAIHVYKTVTSACVQTVQGNTRRWRGPRLLWCRSEEVIKSICLFNTRCHVQDEDSPRLCSSGTTYNPDKTGEDLESGSSQFQSSQELDQEKIGLDTNSISKDV